MATNSRRKRHRILALIAAGAVALVVALVVAVVWIMIRQPDKTADRRAAHGGAADGGAADAGKKPRPEFQDASCPDVQLMSIPGTWESSPQLDPFNPTQFPIALLLNVTNPIREQFGADRLEMFTVPYTAQFHNPLSADKQMSYNDSRAEGTRAAVKAMTDMNNRCPLTSYVLVGFSQGAVIAGDIASDIGNGRGPVDAGPGARGDVDRRRPPAAGVGQDIGPNPAGQGAEITLHEVPMLVGDGSDDDRPAPGRLRHAQRPHQRDLRDRRLDLFGARRGVLDHQPAEDDGDPRRRRGPAGARHVRHAAVLESRRPAGHAVDTGLGAERHR